MLSVSSAHYCLLTVTVLLVVAPVSSDWRIQRGFKARPGQFPWAVRIANCSASIIGRRTLLTAGHCVCRRPSAYAMVGTVDARGGPNTTGITLAIADTLIHPKYACRGPDKEDFALLTLDVPLNWTATVQPIGLWCRGEPDEGAAVVTMGFGKDQRDVSGRLNFANTTLRRSACDSGMMCSPRKANSIYFGDSGGPLVYVRDGVSFQLGVNSGMNVIRAKFASVPRRCDWIKKNMV